MPDVSTSETRTSAKEGLEVAEPETSSDEGDETDDEDEMLYEPRSPRREDNDTSEEEEEEDADELVANSKDKHRQKGVNIIRIRINKDARMDSKVK